MKLFARIVSAMFLLGCAAFAFGQCPSAQQTTVSFTLTDSDSQLWIGAKVTANLYNPSSTQKPLCASTNQTFPISVTATTNGSGVGSMVLTGNGAISPIGTRWIFTIQSQTSANPTITTPLLIQTGGSQSLTSTLDAQLVAPRFQAIAGSYGYNTTEAQPNPCVSFKEQGGLATPQWTTVLDVTPQFFNVSTQQGMVCGSGGGFVPSGGGATIQTNGVDNTSQAVLNHVDTPSVHWTNPSGGVEEASIDQGSIPASLPSNANIVVFGTSQMGVTDTCVNSGKVVTASTITGGVGTFTSANAYIAGDIVTLYRFTGTGLVLNQQSVTILSTGLSTTQFEANVTGITSGTTGAGFVGCSYMAATYLQTTPALPATSSVYLFSPGNASISDLLTDYPTDVHPLSPAVTGKAGFLYIEGGTFEIFSNPGQTAIVEAGLQQLWALAHTDGWTILAMNLFDGAFGGGNSNSLNDERVVNDWMFGQGNQAFPTGVSPNSTPCVGCYWNQIINVHGQFPDRNNTNLYAGTHITSSGNLILAALMTYPLTEQVSFPDVYTDCTNFTQAACDNTINNFSVGQIAYDSTSTESDFSAQDIPNSSPTSAAQIADILVSGVHHPAVVMFQDGQFNIPWAGFTPSGGQFVVFTQGYEQIGFNANGSTGTGGLSLAPSICLSRDATAGLFLNAGNCSAFGNASMGFHMAYQLGTASAPTGACSPNGIFDFSADGVASYCHSGTWSSAFGATAWSAGITVGLSTGAYYSYSCTVNGSPETCYHESINTGLLNNASTTTVSLLHALPTGILGDPICSDNSSRVQSGNTQPVGANFIGGTAPYTTFSVWVGASTENAQCAVDGY